MTTLRFPIPFATLLYCTLHAFFFIPTEADRMALLQSGQGWLVILQTVYDKRGAPDVLQRFAWLLISPLFLVSEWLTSSKFLFSCNVLLALLTADRRQEYSPGRNSVFDTFIDATCDPNQVEWRCGTQLCSEQDIAQFKWCCGSNTYVPIIGVLGAIVATRLARRAPRGWKRMLLRTFFSLGWIMTAMAIAFPLDAETTHYFPWGKPGWKPCPKWPFVWLSGGHTAWIFQGWLVATLLLWQRGTTDDCDCCLPGLQPFLPWLLMCIGCRERSQLSNNAPAINEHDSLRVRLNPSSGQ